ncbi:DUF5078 domain-containing protein [Mycolicibacterium bacteremicum]|uniref:DUF5078 domain-containing protein n=1 Tax=Mycolicibacterium bacteremicum TaxID=564198 RepID=A0A1W9Z2U0_MYCBA|nr:DUF5078 domain-containing protein [Mycolicibacterium bacteremicum]MCV7432005.1 DUF5078 domain-containing protein [Mycolicibacterium bacteremicum]ORA06557.1 hypothetical protein BST17_02560 [Mycolicibacterium bacteremicum]
MSRNRFALAGLAAAAVVTLTPGAAAADATDEYPIPSNMLKTTCTVDQYMAAVRDTNPVYYERYMIDYNNKSPEVQRAARDRITWFFSMDYAGRRQYSEDTATNAFYEQLAWNWPNWAKLFFNNKGVVAHGTKDCLSYPPADPGVWVW